MSALKRSALNKRLRARYAVCGRQARCPAWEFIPASSRFPTKHSRPALATHRIVTTLCPGGKERMRRLMEIVRHGRVDLAPLLTHTFPLDKIGDTYDLFGERLDGVMKIAIRP